MPRPARLTGSRSSARSTAALTLLTVTGATAVWAIVQVADHAPRPGGDLAPSSVTSSTAPARPAPASRPATAPPATTAVNPAVTSPADPGTPDQGRPGLGNPASHPPAPVSHAPAHATPHKPRGSHSVRPAKPPAWIRAECARRFPSGPRRSACITYLQQVMGR